MSANVLVVLCVLGLALASGLEDSEAVSENTIKEEDVKCPHLPCPYPGNCTHKVWSHFWYHGKLCKGCQFCTNNTETINMANDEDVKCPHLPCPLPENCTNKVWSHFWYHGKLCKGCQYCPNNTETVNMANDETGPTCLALPCPPPFPGCAKFEMSYHWYNGKLCPTCEHCVYWNISQPIVARQTGPTCPPPLPCPPPPPGCAKLEMSYHWYNGKLCPTCEYCVYWNISQPIVARQAIFECPVFKCPAPGHCDTELAFHKLTIPGVPDHCKGCPYCPSAIKILKRIPIAKIIYCPDVSCADPGHCDVPYKVSTMTYMGKECPGCPICPITTT